MLIYLFLSVILSVSFLNAEENKTLFCIVDCDSPGFIILEPAIGKDSTQVDSRSIFLDNSTVTFNTTLPDKWTLISSLNNNDNKFHEHVSDQRWETLPNSHSEIAKIMRALENATVSVFLSVRLNKNETSLINGSKIGWNLLMKNGSETYLCDNHQTSCTESHLRLEKSVSELFNNLFSALWKLHDYTYFYTEKITNTEIYTKRESCSYVRKGCLVMYLAMCKNCNMTVLLNPNTVAYSVNGRNNSIMGTGTWMTVEIDLGNFTDCFSLAAETIARNGSEDVFWAIGDTIYISTTLSCHKNKRYISLDTTKKLTDFFCETVTNKPLNFSTQLLKPLNKTEKFPLTTTKNDTVPTNKASSFSVVYIIIIALLITIIITTVVAVLCKRRFWARTPTEASVAFDSVRLLDIASNSETIDRKDWPLPIKRGEFEDYIHKNCDLRESSTELQLQFSASILTKECNEGKKEANLAKNRYPKILPYDDTRVKLKANLGDTGTSDYINASYIKGFNSDKEYIVTQNPLENTAVDFWRMISQEQVEHIVMISNKEEGVHQYWPQFNKTESYGGIEVSFTEHDMYEFYDHRVFTITCFGENRVINQFHFHAWSKEMLAAYVFADFINRLLMIPHQSAPVVFHCKAGVGRSATILLCDIALRSVAITGNFDLFSITKTMRECRVDMVQNIRQYVLAHLIIYEALNYKDLAIGLDEDCENNFSKYFEGNLVKRLWSSYLENREWIDEVIMPYHICANYPKLNRYVDPNLLPVEHSRVKLNGLEEADYIHAMYVNDYNQMKNFIVAQQPMRATMTNFWLMVLEKSVTTIINLHELDPRCGDLCYYPVWNQKFLEINDDILIKLDSEEQHRNYEKLTIIVTRNEQQRKIKLFCIKNWSKIKALPDSTDVVVSLWEAMGDQNPDYPTLICCDDGIRASSFVACFFYMADKMIHERKCDVVGAVRAVRRTHHNFINFEQFVFLFHCAVAFYKNCVE
ncbi:Tyrosine-protein phosphatase Lar-like Protein [Tribolium castaneum]|uniref:protein-tyrosine-phosphatase n=1 Tax=Tribolium castaneum TaxID=7070 RepID=A0A139WBE7_TRICA|nr:Tyrosine-protein phosphatase Lar-like Protein [Tribolium castaneum]